MKDAAIRKQAQRRRDRDAGMRLIQLRLPAKIADALDERARRDQTTAQQAAVEAMERGLAD